VIRRGVLAAATALLAMMSRPRAAGVQQDGFPMGRGIPGTRNMDHVGLTVPDLEQAVRFFVDVLGADELFRFAEGPGTENPADLQ